MNGWKETGGRVGPGMRRSPTGGRSLKPRGVSKFGLMLAKKGDTRTRKKVSSLSEKRGILRLDFVSTLAFFGFIDANKTGKKVAKVKMVQRKIVLFPLSLSLSPSLALLLSL